MSRLCRLKSYQNIGDDGVWAYGEIVSLRQQLAEKDAEIERLKEEVRVTKEEDFPRKAEAVANNWRIKLAASQLREQQLREALDAVQQVANRSEGIAGWHMNGDIASWDSILPEVEQALALPADATALREMIEKAGEVMRERCVIELYKRDDEFITERAIRAIPGMTLEDLQ